MITLELPGLEAHNPLGLFAALGLLRVLDQHAASAGGEAPRLSFVDRGTWIARLSTACTRGEIDDVVLRHAAAQADNVALQLQYNDDGERTAPGTAGATRDLKPSPAGARSLLASVAEAALTSPRTGPRADAAALTAAWFSERVQDNNGNTKPTAFHFTAGQQALLEMVEQLRVGLTADHLREALDGPWRNTSTLPSLGWDASVSRLYALRASNPSTEKRGSVPGANWLAVLGLAFFPVVKRRDRLATTAVRGGWKSSDFVWPVWTPPATARTIASLLRLPRASWTAAARASYGIATVFRASILRSDQGGYGSFTPADVVPPAG
ncbi:MAG TPA: hypothetical protein VFP84_38265 [Kofleriaceae bacterium]|nr:hypothetical protein [Kofleriaceae bacterium]